MSVIAFALLLQAPLQLESITPAQAAKLHGKRVTVRLTISKPPYAWNNQTILGVGSDDEETERGVHLRGERSDVNEGDTITATGTFRLILHQTDGGEWVEFRIEE
jgi:hypothetical protein